MKDVKQPARTFPEIQECSTCGENFTTSVVDQDGQCDQCFNYCECGQRLEDAYGEPGDGFCIGCR